MLVSLQPSLAFDHFNGYKRMNVELDLIEVLRSLKAFLIDAEYVLQY